ncbi:hypothetical protein F5J12DRAFT_918793 [Pisolithus orientalis]|uniref:uncharacterized protein n=1 Tax=Pisolithus orientalis TaxID=936130 RepID=UPI0022246F12|nr:uncharacterized protein F5J12DRAFT_918793 [Pisolithus orientalis]KAI6030595.1 hypothetical protein F5J12DRAFT_918793 [Pisolithus orientalis]
MSSVPKVWFITGSSSGFGLASTELALQRGDKVVATLRKPAVSADLVSKYPDTLLLLKLDVAQPEEVKSTFATARERFGRIDVVLSNAGYGVISEIKGASEKNARGLFETNFWGASYVCREAVKFFREDESTCRWQIDTGLSQCLVLHRARDRHGIVHRNSLSKHWRKPSQLKSPSWNIKVTIVEPGPFCTNCPTTNMVTEPIHPVYNDPVLPSMQLRNVMSNTDTAFTGDPTKLAEAIYKLVYLGDPPLRLPLHNITVETLKEKGHHLIDTADTWASWSEDMYVKE